MHSIQTPFFKSNAHEIQLKHLEADTITERLRNPKKELFCSPNFGDPLQPPLACITQSAHTLYVNRPDSRPGTRALILFHGLA